MRILVRKIGSGRPTHDEGDVFAVFEDGYDCIPSPNSVFWCLIFPATPHYEWDHLLEEKRQPEMDAKRVNWRNRTFADENLVHRRRMKLSYDAVPEHNLSELKLRGFTVMPFSGNYSGYFSEK